MSTVKTTDVIGNQMPLGELWESLAKLTTHISDDNKKYPDQSYPIEIRSHQMTSVLNLLEGIQQHHTKARMDMVFTSKQV